MMAVFRSDDPVADFDRHDAAQQHWLDSLPRCEWCGEAVQDEVAYHIGDAWIHTDCIDYYLERL